ncbi:hypothetical protein ACU8KH_00027 [Lachancea thermotolerans]
MPLKLFIQKYCMKDSYRYSMKSLSAFFMMVATATAWGIALGDGYHAFIADDATLSRVVNGDVFNICYEGISYGYEVTAEDDTSDDGPGRGLFTVLEDLRLATLVPVHQSKLKR